MSKTNTTKPLFKSKLRSDVVRTAITELENAGNDRQDQIDALTTPPAGNEVTNARDYASVLRDRLRYSDRARTGNKVISGLEVSASSPAAMTVDYSSGYAIVDGVLCNVTGGTSGTLTAPTNKQWAVVVVNSDNSISIELGNDSNDRILPSIASSQRPLALIDLESTTTEITNAEITDISEQGCEVDGHWFFKIQDAVNSIDDRANNIDAGHVVINKGEYFEEVDLSGLNNIWLDFRPGAKLYRVDDSSYCILSINTVGNETTGIKITGADLRGNGKAGAYELLKFDYTDKFKIIGCQFDGNASSTATYKNFVFSNCDRFYVMHMILIGGHTTRNYDTCTYHIEENYNEINPNILTDGDITAQGDILSFGGITAIQGAVIRGGETLQRNDSAFKYYSPAYDGPYYVKRKIAICYSTTNAFVEFEANSELSIESEKAYAVWVTIFGRRCSMTKSAFYKRMLIIKNSGGTTSLVGSVQTIGTDIESDAVWDIQLTADDTNDRLKMEAKGASSENVIWQAEIKYMPLG